MIPKIVWSIFFAISSGVIISNWSPALWEIRNPLSYGKFAFWAAYLIFTAYGLYATKREDFFKAVRKIGSSYWGKQIGIDLYIGFIFFILFIGMHQGILPALLWSIPILVYGNQLTLLYLAVHHESILRKFMV